VRLSKVVIYSFRLHGREIAAIVRHAGQAVAVDA